MEENPGCLPLSSILYPNQITKRLSRTLPIFTSDPVALTLGTDKVHKIRADDFLARLCPISASGHNLTATIQRVKQRNYRSILSIIGCQLVGSGFVDMS
jgi:hypothetical protein